MEDDILGKCGGYLPPACEVGLTSAVAVGFTVKLWTYQSSLRGIPKGVEVCQAESLLPLGQCHGLLGAGWRIAQISALVRLLAIVQMEGGWFVDCDTWWLRSPSTLKTISGHVFGTRATESKPDERFFKLHYVRTPHAREDLATPFCFPPESVLASELLEWYMGLCAGCNRTDSSNSFVHKIAELISKHGLTFDVVPAEVFSPIHNFFDISKLQERGAFDVEGTYHGHRTLSAQGIIDCSTAVNHFWQTSQSTRSNDNAALSSEPGSVMDRLLRRMPLDATVYGRVIGLSLASKRRASDVSFFAVPSMSRRVRRQTTAAQVDALETTES